MFKSISLIMILILPVVLRTQIHPSIDTNTLLEITPQNASLLEPLVNFNIRTENLPDAVGFSGLTISPDGQTLAVRFADSRLEPLYPNAIVQFWDVESWQLMSQYEQRDITPYGFSPSGRFYAFGAGNTLNLYDLERQEITFTIDTDSYIPDIKFSPDGRYMAVLTTSPDELRVWDLESFAMMWRVELNGCACVFRPDSTLLVVGTRNGRVLGWNVEDWSQPREVFDYTGEDTSTSISDLSFTPSGRRLIAYGDLTIQVLGLDDSDDNPLFSGVTFDSPIVSRLGLILFMRDAGTIFGYVHRENDDILPTTTIFDAESLQDLFVLDWEDVFAINEQETLIATQPVEKTDIAIQLREVATGELLREFPRTEYGPDDFLFSPTGDYILTTDLEMITFWGVRET